MLAAGGGVSRAGLGHHSGGLRAIKGYRPLKGDAPKRSEGPLGKTTYRSSLITTLRTLTTHLLPPAVTARSQHHGTAQEVPFCLAVCTEAKSGVVELKVDIHTEVNPDLHARHPLSDAIPLLHSLECSSRCHVQATS